MYQELALAESNSRLISPYLHFSAENSDFLGTLFSVFTGGVMWIQFPCQSFTELHLISSRLIQVRLKRE